MFLWYILFYDFILLLLLSTFKKKYPTLKKEKICNYIVFSKFLFV